MTAQSIETLTAKFEAAEAELKAAAEAFGPLRTVEAEQQAVWAAWEVAQILAREAGILANGPAVMEQAREQHKAKIELYREVYQEALQVRTAAAIALMEAEQGLTA